MTTHTPATLADEFERMAADLEAVADALRSLTGEKHIEALLAGEWRKAAAMLREAIKQETIDAGEKLTILQSDKDCYNALVHNMNLPQREREPGALIIARHRITAIKQENSHVG